MMPVPEVEPQDLPPSGSPVCTPKAFKSEKQMVPLTPSEPVPAELIGKIRIAVCCAGITQLTRCQ